MSARFDIAIIGGGISGLGLARAAAIHGLDVILLEGRQLTSATSANSLRIVHGGFRYLQNLDLKRVNESVKAQRYIREHFKEFISPLPCLLPINKFGLQSYLPVKIAGYFYDVISKRGSQYKTTVINRSKYLDLGLPLPDRFKHGALQWWDDQIIDQDGFFQALASDSRNLGAEIIQNSPVTKISKSENWCEVITEQGNTIRADIVLDTTGFMTTSISGALKLPPTVKWCSAWNIKLKRYIDPKFALALKGRNRALFFTPRKDEGCVGTWYSWETIELSDARCLEISLKDLHADFPELEINSDSVLGIERGFLPAIGSKNSEPLPLSRRITLREGRSLKLIATKFTTFPTQSEDILRSIAPFLRQE